MTTASRFRVGEAVYTDAGRVTGRATVTQTDGYGFEVRYASGEVIEYSWTLASCFRRSSPVPAPWDVAGVVAFLTEEG